MGGEGATLFRPNFQVHANPVRNLKGVGEGVMICGVSQAGTPKSVKCANI